MIYLSIYLSIYTHTHTHTHIYIYIYIYIFMSIYMRCLYICVCDRLPGLSQPTVYCYLYYPPSSHRVRRCICHPIFHNNCPLVLIPPPFCPQGKKLHLPPRSFKTKFSLLLVLPPFWPLGKKLHPPPDLSQPTALCYLYYPFGFTRDRVNPQLHLPPDLSQPTAH